jgi:glycosyltransferase involved in cell wall biosynthesis
MNLLVVTNNPDRASFRQRIAVYLDSLKANDITAEVAQMPRWILSRRKLFAKAKDFDAVLLHKKILNPIDAHYLRKYAGKIIYDFDDAIMYDNNHPEKTHHKRQHHFQRTIAMADLVIAGNEYLAEHAKKFNSNVEILPTGLDISIFKTVAKKSTDAKIRLVWIGSRPTLRNLEQISPALEEIGSRFDNVVLKIISDDFIDLRKIPVEKHKWSLESEATELAGSDIGLAPLDDDNFTRGKCGFKILQYQAAGLPVVASPVGVNAELVRENVNGFIAITIDDWIEKISSLITNRQLRIQFGHSAGQSVAAFDLSVLAPRFVSLIKRVIAS